MKIKKSSLVTNVVWLIAIIVVLLIVFWLIKEENSCNNLKSFFENKGGLIDYCKPAENFESLDACECQFYDLDNLEAGLTRIQTLKAWYLVNESELVWGAD